LLVVSRSEPACSSSLPERGWRKTNAQPPGPGLPLHAPSEKRITSAGLSGEGRFIRGRSTGCLLIQIIRSRGGESMRTANTGSSESLASTHGISFGPHADIRAFSQETLGTMRHRTAFLDPVSSARQFQPVHARGVCNFHALMLKTRSSSLFPINARSLSSGRRNGGVRGMDIPRTEKRNPYFPRRHGHVRSQPGMLSSGTSRYVCGAGMPSSGKRWPASSRALVNS
jgi:hypothetical protein